MGGYGSGSSGSARCGSARYSVAEESRIIRLSVLRQRGAFKEYGMYVGGYAWNRGGIPCGDVMVRVERTEHQAAQLIVAYNTRAPRAEAWSPVNEVFRLTTTQPHYGGQRWWVHCLCGQRSANLYCPPGSSRYRCRYCAQIVYACQREKEPDRLLRRATKIWRKLGEQGGFVERAYGSKRPRYMRRATYRKLRSEADMLDRVSFALAMQRWIL